jgi:hypothetical protein
MVINFEGEKFKRADYQNVCEELLEDFLYSFCISDEDSKKEDALKTFVKELNLGPTPLTHFVRTYFHNPDAQFSANNILKEVPLSVLKNVVEFIGSCWPQEQSLVKKLSVLLIGFDLKKIKMKGPSPMRNSPGKILERIGNYLLDNNNSLETEILSPSSNVIMFPSFKRSKEYPCLIPLPL